MYDALVALLNARKYHLLESRKTMFLHATHINKFIVAAVVSVFCKRRTTSTPALFKVGSQATTLPALIPRIDSRSNVASVPELCQPGELIRPAFAEIETLDFISLHVTSLHFTSFTSFYFTSLRFSSLHFISFYFNHFFSFKVFLFPFVSI